MTDEQRATIKRNAELDAAFQLFWYFDTSPESQEDRTPEQLSTDVIVWAKANHPLRWANLAQTFESATLAAIGGT